MQLGRSLEGSVPAIDGYPAWRRQKSRLPLRVYTRKSYNEHQGCETGFSWTEEFLESIIKTYCTWVGLGAGFVWDFQRF